MTGYVSRLGVVSPVASMRASLHGVANVTSGVVKVAFASVGEMSISWLTVPIPDPSSEATRPLRVLLWSPRGAGTQYYGPGSFHYRLYSAAAPGQFEITLVHGLPEQQQFDLFAGQHFLGPLPNHDDPPLSRWRMTKRFLKAADSFLRDRHDAFDVFHGLTGFVSTVQPAACAEQLGLPAVVFLANHQIDLQDTARLQRMLGLARKRRRMAAQCSGIIAMSSAIARELRECGIADNQILRIPMAVDVDRFRPARDAQERSAVRRELGWADRPTLLFVGRLGRRKRPNLLLEAVGAAAAAGHDCQAAIAGPSTDATFMAEMRDRAAALNITDRIIWAGFHEDPAPLYRAADVFALPSANEGMPAAVVEAMASGLPSIVTRISGCEDLITDDQTGKFINPTPAEAADAWLAYLQHDTIRKSHGDAAREQAQREYSTARVLEQYAALFLRLRRH